MSQAMGNFINLPYSVAMRHQFLQCHYNAINVDTLGTQLLVGPGTFIVLCDFMHIMLIKCTPYIQGGKVSRMVRSVSIH